MTEKTNEKTTEAPKPEDLKNYGYDPKALVSCPSGEMYDPTNHEELRKFSPGPTRLGEVTPWMNLQLKAGKLVLDKDD